MRPEPSPDEREALERALEQLAADVPHAYGSAWRRAGLELEEED